MQQLSPLAHQLADIFNAQGISSNIDGDGWHHANHDKAGSSLRTAIGTLLQSLSTSTQQLPSGQPKLDLLDAVGELDEADPTALTRHALVRQIIRKEVDRLMTAIRAQEDAARKQANNLAKSRKRLEAKVKAQPQPEPAEPVPQPQPRPQPQPQPQPQPSTDPRIQGIEWQ
jgi:hypothetical protein